MDFPYPLVVGTCVRVTGQPIYGPVRTDPRCEIYGTITKVRVRYAGTPNEHVQYQVPKQGFLTRNDLEYMYHHTVVEPIYVKSKGQ